MTAELRLLICETIKALEAHALRYDGLGGVRWHGCAICQGRKTMHSEPVVHSEVCLIERLKDHAVEH